MLNPDMKNKTVICAYQVQAAKRNTVMFARSAPHPGQRGSVCGLQRRHPSEEPEKGRKERWQRIHMRSREERGEFSARKVWGNGRRPARSDRGGEIRAAGERGPAEGGRQ